MGRWYQVWLSVILVVLMASMAFAQDIPVGKTVGRVESAPVPAPEKYTPEPVQEQVIASKNVKAFILSINGSNADMMTQGFLEYARAIGQPIEMLDYGGRFRIELHEEYDTSQDFWGGIATQLGNRATRGQLDLRADGKRKLVLKAEIKEGNRIHYIYSTSKSGMRVRINAAAWNKWANAYAGKSKDPDTGLRLKAVRDLIPLVMAELQNLVAAECVEADQALASDDPPARRTTRSTKPAAVTTILRLDGGTRTFPGRVKQMDKIKLYRGKKKVGEIWCRLAFQENGTNVALMAEDTTLALESDITLRR